MPVRLSGGEMRIAVLWVVLAGAVSASAQTAANVLLVLNESSPASLEIGQYYAEKRQVPPGNIVRLKLPVQDAIERNAYDRLLEAPLAAWFEANSAHDRILYIVLTKGVPLRISGTTGAEGTTASVDSELSLLYRKMTSQAVPAVGSVANPYFLADSPVTSAVKFSHEARDIYLVTRLDGFTVADVRGLIDRAVGAVQQGKVVLDGKQGGPDQGGTWLQTAADRLKAMGFGDRVVHDATEKVLTGIQPVLGYYSWGSNDSAIRIRHFGMGFSPGALAGMFVSSDGRTFTEPPASWQLGAWGEQDSYYAGSPQSLAGDLVREGVTGVAGHVSEPFLEATIRPDILFPAYFSGFNLAESFYLAMPYLSWQTVVVGDPLCAPFRTSSLRPEQIDTGIDEQTELPAFFGPRRFVARSVPGYQKAHVLPDTTRLLIRAEVRIAKKDMAGARRILEEATSRDGRLVAAHMLLAGMYELAKEYSKAEERYRLVLHMIPENPVALNNLAYVLAVRQGKPAEALPLAEKAYAVSKGSPSMADTLGWTHHLMGDNAKAKQYLVEAVGRAPGNAEIHLHSAIVQSALGEDLAAAAALARALELDPALAGRDDVRELQVTLKLPQK
jgi:uncharacterized protein (TIGR03790 family)